MESVFYFSTEARGTLPRYWKVCDWLIDGLYIDAQTAIHKYLVELLKRGWWWELQSLEDVFCKSDFLNVHVEIFAFPITVVNKFRFYEY